MTTPHLQDNIEKCNSSRSLNRSSYIETEVECRVHNSVLRTFESSYFIVMTIDDGSQNFGTSEYNERDPANDNGVTIVWEATDVPISSVYRPLELVPYASTGVQR